MLSFAREVLSYLRDFLSFNWVYRGK